jgi:hypothetical protein
MLWTVEFHTDFALFVAHVDTGERNAEPIANHHLRLGFPQTGTHEQQSGPRFLRRFGTAVHQVQRLP